MQDDFDCLACGACCFGPPTAYIDVRATDLVRMTPATIQRFVRGERSKSLRMNQGHCAALKLRPGQRKTTQHFCVIYDQRPEPCRSITPGNRECLAARRRLGRD